MARDSGNAALGKLVAGLKRIKPSSCVVVARDGEETTVALTGQRNRYERAGRSIMSLEAQLVRCIDRDGAVAEVIRIGGEDDDDEIGPSRRDRDVPGEVERLLSLYIHALDRTRGRDLEIMAEVTGAATAQLRINSDRAERLERTLMLTVVKRERDLVQAADSLADRLEEFEETKASSGEDSMSAADKTATEMLGSLLELAGIGGVKQAAAAPAPLAVQNGRKK